MGFAWWKLNFKKTSNLYPATVKNERLKIDYSPAVALERQRAKKNEHTQRDCIQMTTA